MDDNWMKIGGGIHRFSIDFRGVVGDQRRPRCAKEAQVRPQYGDSVATSLKNVQNLPKSSKLRQNSV